MGRADRAVRFPQNDFSTLKFPIRKLGPSMVIYRYYRTFWNEYFLNSFGSNIKEKHISSSGEGFEKFRRISVKLLNERAPGKQKSVKGNDSPFLFF